MRIPEFKSAIGVTTCLDKIYKLTIPSWMAGQLYEEIHKAIMGENYPRYESLRRFLITDPYDWDKFVFMREERVFPEHNHGPRDFFKGIRNL